MTTFPSFSFLCSSSFLMSTCLYSSYTYGIRGPVPLHVSPPSSFVAKALLRLFFLKKVPLLPFFPLRQLMLIPLGHDILRLLLLLLLLLRATKKQRSIFVNFQDRGREGQETGHYGGATGPKIWSLTFSFFFLLLFRIFNGSLVRAVQFLERKRRGSRSKDFVIAS